MGAVDTDSPRIKYLNTKVSETSPPGTPDAQRTFEARIECYDNGVRTLHKAWKGYIIGFKYKTTEQGAQFGTELHIMLGEGSQVCDLGMVLKSGTARGFMRAMEHLNLRQPVTFRPWSYEDESVKDVAKRTKIGGFNLEQGGRQVAYKYLDTAEGCNGMPLPETQDDGAGGTNKTFGKQITFLRNILDTVIEPKVNDIAAMGAFEDEDMSAIKQIAPSLEKKQLGAGPTTSSAPTVTASSVAATDGPPSPEDDDGLPF